MMLCQVRLTTTASPPVTYTRAILWPGNELPSPFQIDAARSNEHRGLVCEDGTKLWWNDDHILLVEVMEHGERDPAPVGACPSCGGSVVCERTTMLTGQCGKCGQPVVTEETIDAVGATMDEKP